MEALPQQFVAIDLETTGGRAGQDRITEIALVGFRDGQKIHAWCSFINPGRPIHPMVSRMTGITDRHVRHAPTFEQVASYVHTYMCRAGVVVAHNLKGVEKRLLGAALGRAGLAWPHQVQEICTLDLARSLRRSGALQAESLKLNVLCDTLGVELRRHHRAEADAEACGRCLVEMGHLLGRARLL